MLFNFWQIKYKNLYLFECVHDQHSFWPVTKNAKSYEIEH